MKKEMWGALLIVVLVVGVIGYMNKHAIKVMLMGSPTPTTQSGSDYSSTASPATSPTDTAGSKNVLTTSTDPKKGAYLVSSTGMTLYTYDKDSQGKPSVCAGGCAQAWPAYKAGTTAGTEQANLTTTTSTDGSLQYAYKGWNLYYYANDEKPGDITGDGVGGVWHLVKP